MKTYHGSRPHSGTGPQPVYVMEESGERLLDPKFSLQIRNHSPDGFQWGYAGSGPAQLALAMLLDHFNQNVGHALAVYQKFKWSVIASLPDTWSLTSEDIDQVLKTFPKIGKR
jgi:hypothetical protein